MTDIDTEYESIWEGWISTYTGKQFDWRNPEFDMEDIVHSLSNLCRFNGHCLRFYSVAEHSVLVSYLCEHAGGDPMEALLHDACEAYVGDVPSPLRQFMPDHKKVEEALETKFRKEYNLPPSKTEECAVADRAAAILEGQRLMRPEIYKQWLNFPEDAIKLSEDWIETKGWEYMWNLGVDPYTARDMFIRRYAELQEQTRED